MVEEKFAKRERTWRDELARNEETLRRHESGATTLDQKALDNARASIRNYRHKLDALDRRTEQDVEDAILNEVKIMERRQYNQERGKEF
eukprot:CAMPEP_0172510150 /NCGR_PEP_ID=MMETSP1066-20121228/226668_1 /TAXON_ID=671091 /ORGANISM="Coscinodiscus wailesii, Strain CCMP2513" /LENGTH=88 /DNA_ID=CAMNT_0013289003 /DNA_START=288 /DNA_END=554 /DNA_ORIENTATION=+